MNYRFRSFALFTIWVVITTTPWLNSGFATEFKRELSTDRPDKTESPYTVEAGRVQFETNLLEFGFLDTKPTDTTVLRTRRASFGTIAKYGLSDRLDIQVMLGWEGMSHWTEGLDPGQGESKYPKLGLSDPGIRLKLNLTGRDAGGVAIGLMPYVTIPIGTAPTTTDTWQGGLIIPGAIALGDRTGCGLMVEFDANANDDGEGHHIDFVTSATIAVDISSTLGMYAELFQEVDLRGNRPWAPTFDSGFTIAASNNVQIDFGVNFGLNEHADDVNPFLGLSFRL